MYFEFANKRQLLTIALYEDCDIDLKYEACRELQMRQWRDEFLTQTVILYGKGYRIVDIAAEIGIPEYTVQNILKKNGLYGKRVKGCKTENYHNI